MAVGHLDRQPATEGETEQVGAAEVERPDEARDDVGVVGEGEDLRGIRRPAAARRA